ncbi:MAG: hypothetical protein WD431_17255 [Cyclobacteriaceae bacterium]
MNFTLRINLLLVFFLLPLLLYPKIASSQNVSPYFTFSEHDRYLEYLIHSGRVDLHHVLNQPFTVNELYTSLPVGKNQSNNHWMRLLKNDLSHLINIDTESDSLNKFVVGIEGGTNVSYQEKEFDNYFLGSLFTGFFYKNFGLFHRFKADESFKFDSLFSGTTGKLQNANFARSTESYLQWNHKSLSLFIGRVKRNFGIMNEPGLLLSPNPHSYDQIGLTFSNRQLEFISLFARLEDKIGFDIRDSDPNPVLNKRFISLHRIDLSITDKVKLAISESILFGGEDQVPMFQYLNPVNIFFLSKMSDRKNFEERRASAKISFEAYYKPLQRITVYSQVLIDDIDLKKSLRKVYPDRLGFMFKSIYSDPFPESQIALTYNRISNWTYNSFYTFGNYTFYSQSLGFPKHGYESLRLDIDFFGFSPFLVGAKLQAIRERKQDLNSPFIAEKTAFPTGVVQSIYTSSLNFTYYPDNWLYIDLSLELKNFTNHMHIQGNNKLFINVLLTLKTRNLFGF